LRELGLGDRVLLDRSSAVVTNESNLLGYYSWGSNDPAMTTRQHGLTFAAGALAGAFVSTDGRSFKEPPADWTHGRWDNPRTFFAGSPQSMAGDLIRQGVTGVSAHVAEPFLDATIRPDILFPAYASGFNLAESFYLAMPSLSWQTVIVGDPLAAPFRRQDAADSELDPGLDDLSELPVLFAARTLKLAARIGRTPEASGLMLRATSRLVRGDRAGSREALEQATLRAPDLSEGHLLLATLYEGDGELPNSVVRYRRVIAIDPGHVVALNNLAYLLATRGGATAVEAVGLARRAAALAPNNPAVLDTLAWVLHLTGDTTSARTAIATALRHAPDAAELLLHGAIIDAAANEPDAARLKLDRALNIDASLTARPEVKDLLAKLPERAAAPAAGRRGRAGAPAAGQGSPGRTTGPGR
jgi:tetratricopeptide (TPR) repeat protein